MYYGIANLTIDGQQFQCTDCSLQLKLSTEIQKVSTNVSRIISAVNGQRTELTYSLTMSFAEVSAIELLLPQVAGGQLSHSVTYSQFFPLALSEQLSAQPNRYASFDTNTLSESLAPHGPIELSAPIECVMVGLDDETLVITGDFTATSVGEIINEIFSISGIISNANISQL